MKTIILEHLKDVVAPLTVEETASGLLIHDAKMTMIFAFDSKGSLVNVATVTSWEATYVWLVKVYVAVNQAVSMNEALEVSRNDE